MNRAQLAFSLLAVVIVCSLVGTAVGTAIVDELTSPRRSETFRIDDFEDDLEVELRRAVEERPDDARAAASLANYLATTGRLTEAIPWYEKALALQPEDWDIRLDFAQSLADGGRRADAELQFKKVIAAQPGNAHAHFYLAELYRSWVPPRTEEAVAEYRRTIEVGPETYVAELATEALRQLGEAMPTAVGIPATTLEEDLS